MINRKILFVSYVGAIFLLFVALDPFSWEDAPSSLVTLGLLLIGTVAFTRSATKSSTDRPRRVYLAVTVSLALLALVIGSAERVTHSSMLGTFILLWPSAILGAFLGLRDRTRERISHPLDIYLDIDGVLLDRHGKPALGLVEFLQWATKGHNCIWLTTHCKDDTESCERYVRRVLPDATWPYTDKILHSKWDTFKTEGIDWSRRFLWLDDTMLESERTSLMAHNSLKRFIKIDLERNPHQLSEIMESVVRS